MFAIIEKVARYPKEFAIIGRIPSWVAILTLIPETMLFKNLFLISNLFITFKTKILPSTAPKLIWKPTSKINKGPNKIIIMKASKKLLKESYCFPKSRVKIKHKHIMLALTTEGENWQI